MTRACVIGARSAGLAAAKALKERGDFDCFEARDRVGGLWAFDENPDGPSAAYRGLNSNAPMSIMQYYEFPLPKSLPGFPSHRDFARYFEDYAERFGLLEHIRFNPRGHRGALADCAADERFQRSSIRCRNEKHSAVLNAVWALSAAPA